MKRSIIPGLMVLLFLGSYGIFAQETADLPEPLFVEDFDYAVPAFPQESGFWLPGFDEVVYYLWNFSVTPGPAIEILPVAALAAAADSDVPVPGNIRNNKYFIESVRLTNLAQKAFEDGDYDLSTQYSAEAVKYAELSDEYVKLQLKIKETNDAIAAAKNRLDWAASSPVNARQRYPNEYTAAETAYKQATDFRKAEAWDDAIAAAQRVISALAYVTETPPAPPAPPPPAPEPSEYALPAQYTVRPWSISKDCLWNIAGRSWAYGDPTKWKLLYNANRVKLPQPDNPDLIHPGMILDIPSIKGEIREGRWDAARSYVPLP